MSAPTESSEYATSMIVFTSTKLVTTTVIKTTSQDEGDNGHTNTTIDNNIGTTKPTTN